MVAQNGCQGFKLCNKRFIRNRIISLKGLSPK